MKASQKNNYRLALGVIISVIFTYLAFRNVDLYRVWSVLHVINYWYLFAAVIILFFAHFIRALRWRYLLDPINRLNIVNLFTSLIIGYAANTFMPAHLGEVLRAYVLSRDCDISTGMVFGTIVVERLVDILSLFLLMLLMVYVYPFPDWVVKSGIIMISGGICFLILIMLFKTKKHFFINSSRWLLKPFGKSTTDKILNSFDHFSMVIMPLKSWFDYLIVFLLSVLLWFCHTLVFFFCISAFGFPDAYRLGWTASLVVLVITTIAIVVPSTPGYLGTYHYLAKVSLVMFGVSGNEALSYALILHAVNFFPVFFIGIIFTYYKHENLFKISQKMTSQ